MAGAVVTATLVFLPAEPAVAEPSRRELTAQEKKLADQAEQLSEQYNGLRVRLQQAQRAAKVAKDNARRQNETLTKVRAQVAQVAADAYKNGAVDPTTAMVSSGDPQAILDRSATLNFLAQQHGTQVGALLQAVQSSERARRSAESRAKEVRDLTAEAERKRRELQTRLTKVQKALGKITPSKPGQAPKVAPGKASAKAMGAVRAALSQLGVPYSWGGGSASGPTYGTAQGRNIKGFDCSGLTLYAYAQVGINLPHYTGSQFTAGTRVSQGQLQPGDLVFFYSDLHHMGMYIGGGKMVHAPQTGDVVKVSSISGRPFAGGVRVA
ncbi:NlpC/P60 family protein [Actinomadura rudentiformis]|uniref:NlpC/P60 family protein n=2 Tax=Actinomadura rudentiformis TaxID=359158 RepID=A0A6H9YL20_9ACTN|nr:NlpC/P60 family protein [Actinomadura rudentiformis]